jgi:glucan phosphoethanolaminetransferase (alkaline phosphatase superfamily)
VPALLLAGVFILAKIAIIWPVNSLKQVLNLLTVTGEDLVAAVLYGLLAGAALWATQRNINKRTWLSRLTWGLTLTLGAIAALYAVVNVGIYGYLQTPLNARMFTLIGRLNNIRSSVAAQCSVGLIAWLIAMPVMYVLLATGWMAKVLEKRWIRASTLVVGVVWICTSFVLLSQTPPDSPRRRAARSPHYEILASLFRQFLTDRRADLGGDFPTQYLDDFKLASERHYSCVTTPQSRPRNVIVVVLESVTAQYMSLYGSRFETTPNLAAEAQHAMVFDHGYAEVGWTYLSRLPLLYSIAPGLPWKDGWKVINHRKPLGLAKILKDSRGYRTAFFSGGDPEWDNMYWTAQDAGMDEVFGPKELGGRMASSWGTEDGILVDGLVRWIDKDRGRPFYALMWTDQTHHPYTLAHDTKPVDFLDESKAPNGQLLERYLNALHQADTHLGRLFQALRERGLADDTLVVITGDHGEAFGDPHPQMVGHGGGLFDENLRVPMIFWNPRLFPAGERNDRPAGHIDINPTIAHLLGIFPPDDWQGASLLSDDHPSRTYFIAFQTDYQFGVTDGRYKYILDVDAGYERMYDLQTDSREQTDVAPEHRALANELHGRLSAFIQDEQRYLDGTSLPSHSAGARVAAR